MKSWKENVTKIHSLLLQVSNNCGGDDPHWLEGYFQQLLLENSNNLQEVIDALEDMSKFKPEHMNAGRSHVKDAEGLAVNRQTAREVQPLT